MKREGPNPSLSDFIDARIKLAMASMNCVSIGTIQSFDAVLQQATVSLNYKRIIKDGAMAANNIDTQDVIKEYPLLMKCPVVVMNGGGAAITLPIKVGDSCVILFNDRDIDTWLTTGSTANPPNSPRLHNLSDAIALVGIHPFGNPLSHYNIFHIQINNPDGRVQINADDSIDLISSNVNASANLSAGTGFSGSFSTGSGQVVTVANGIIINVD